MGRRVEIQIDRNRLLGAAFDLLQAEGLDGLTMRGLAARLSVQAPALYWYIGDKAELLGLMARELYAQARAAVPEATDWRQWLIGFGHALRQSLTAHRDGARLCAIAPPLNDGDALGQRQAIAAPLVRLGLDETRSCIFQASVISLTLGWATFQENGPMQAFLGNMLNFDIAFAIGLDALVRGYAAELAPNAATT